MKSFEEKKLAPESVYGKCEKLPIVSLSLESVVWTPFFEIDYLHNVLLMNILCINKAKKNLAIRIFSNKTHFYLEKNKSSIRIGY